MAERVRHPPALDDRNPDPRPLRPVRDHSRGRRSVHLLRRGRGLPRPGRAGEEGAGRHAGGRRRGPVRPVAHAVEHPAPLRLRCSGRRAGNSRREAARGGDSQATAGPAGRGPQGARRGCDHGRRVVPRGAAALEGARPPVPGPGRDVAGDGPCTAFGPGGRDVGPARSGGGSGLLTRWAGRGPHNAGRAPRGGGEPGQCHRRAAGCAAPLRGAARLARARVRHRPPGRVDRYGPGRGGGRGAAFGQEAGERLESPRPARAGPPGVVHVSREGPAGR